MTQGEQVLHDIFRSSFVRRKGLSGPGDDCARLVPPAGARLALSTDQLVAGVHVAADARPGVMARKLLRRSLSDLAAAGATPWAVSWTVAAPPATSLGWLKRLARAFLDEAALFECSVIGGDLSRAAQLVLGCTVIGREGRRPAPGRGGARPGDWLLVTGRLGDAVRSGRHLLPEPRLTEGRALVDRYRAHALMDLSDGLAADLPRMTAASGVGAVVELDALPLARGLAHDRDGWSLAVGEGEDYELLACLPPAEARRALNDPLLRRTGLHVIGDVVEGSGLRWEVDGAEVELDAAGWEYDWS